jgi:hypothetical protein
MICSGAVAAHAAYFNRLMRYVETRGFGFLGDQFRDFRIVKLANLMT